MNSKFLVIGHTGFIGSKLVNYLAKKKSKIFLISHKLTKIKKSKFHEYNYDVFENFSWFKHLQNNMTVFFLAFNNNLYELEKNEAYMLKMINFCIKFNEYLIDKNLKIKLVFTSTSTIYGSTSSRVTVNENFIDNPLSVYDKSKLLFEKICISYSKRKNLKFVSLRFSNIYGNYSKNKQTNRGFLNKLILKSINDEKISIIGNGSKKRSYVYIDDIINALIVSSNKIDKLNSKIFLICANRSYSFNEILDIIKLKLNKNLKINKINFPKNMHKIEKRSFIGSNLKFKKFTGWKPYVDLRQGIEKIINQNL